MTMKDQLQIDQQKQIRDQAYSYGIIGSIFSAFECYANKFQTDPSKQTNIFSAYNNFGCGNKKDKKQLKIQIIAQLEVLNASFQLYIFQYDHYDFPKNLGQKEMKQYLSLWKDWVPEEDKKYYEEADNIISGKPHISYKNELGTNAHVNPNFFANATEMMYQANKVGENAVENFKKTGDAPGMDLYSKKVGNENINKTDKRENQRRKEVKEIDALFDDVFKELSLLMAKDPPKEVNVHLPIENKIQALVNRLFTFKQEWQMYWYQDNKKLHIMKVKEIIELCKMLIRNGYAQVLFNALFDQFSDDNK